MNKSITIDGIEYVPKTEMAWTKGLSYCIVRGESSGVQAGYIVSRDGREVNLVQARRLWYWSGASSLSELSTKGPAKPDECKFPTKVREITILDAIEILPCTVQAQGAIEAVPVWTSHE